MHIIYYMHEFMNKLISDHYGVSLIQWLLRVYIHKCGIRDRLNFLQFRSVFMEKFHCVTRVELLLYSGTPLRWIT